jgi:Tol biopolymer transport system component
VLRQFALEGRLPGYSTLSATGPWQTSNFAYLAGSAFFDWLARREGDSSVTALWRRMTAKTVRSFDDSFAGVYGDAPATLYQRFVAELTADALAFERTLTRDALVPGTLVQRLIRNTGDPAVSPDGRFIALVVRHVTLPSELVVWRTADEPDTLVARRRAYVIERDSDDVPDRSFYPPPKRTIISLVPSDGASYESPRWMSDNKHLVVTRRMPMSDGTLRSDLFIWSAEDGALRRITAGAAVRDADPSADGRWAAAVRCDRGWCDLVRVDLASGAVRVLAPGSETRNYYRPRVSKRTGEIAVAEQSGDRWRIVRVSSDGAAFRYADPDDGVTRYDATFDADGRTIVATSEAGGVANIERLDPVDLHPTRLTAVTGAAVSADVAPDGTLWFLSLQAGGYDLRRLRPDSASISRARNASGPLHLGLVDSLSPILPPHFVQQASDSSRRPPQSGVSEERPYGTGPSRYRYLPGGTTGFGGSSILLGIVRSDPVGRLGIAVFGAVGAGSLPAGVALTATSRASRTERILNLWSSHEGPSARFAAAFEEGLDLTRSGGALRLQRSRIIDGGEILGTVGLLAERQHSAAWVSRTRGAAIAAFSIVGRQRDEELRYQEQLSGVVETGTNGDDAYHRQRSAFFFGVGSGSRPLTTVRLAYGTVGGIGGSDRERFVIGGFASPLIDPLLDGRRVDAPAYPVGSSTSTSFSSFRLALPLPPVELFYGGSSPDLFRTSLRSYGVEYRQRVAAVPALGTPDVDVLTGFARALDAPVTKEWRYYVTLAVKP